jgi:hypothetical protein
MSASQAGLKQPFSFYMEIARSAFGLKSEENIPLFENWFLIDGVSQELPELLQSVLLSDDATLLNVKAAFSFLNHVMFRPMVGNGVIDSPEFTAAAMTSMLVAEKSKIPIQKFLADVPNPEGFLTVKVNVLNALNSAQPILKSKNQTP